MGVEMLTKEFIIEHYFGKYLTQTELGAIAGCSQHVVSRTMKKLGIVTRQRGRIVNLVGQEFGWLTVLEPVFKCDSRGEFRWRCRCRCGNVIEARRGNLRAGIKKSCGCLKESKVGNAHQAWRGHGSIPGGFLSRYKSHAKRRGIEFTLSLGYLDELFGSQNGCCAISGIQLSFEHYGYKCEYSTASLDRIDSNGNYEEGNVQWLHKDVNFMKQSFPQDKFLKLCRTIVEYNEKP